MPADDAQVRKNARPIILPFFSLKFSMHATLVMFQTQKKTRVFHKIMKHYGKKAEESYGFNIISSLYLTTCAMFGFISKNVLLLMEKISRLKIHHDENDE
jgi:hypothetical protein